MLRGRLAFVVALGAAAACGRVEEPSSTGGARAASAVPRRDPAATTGLASEPPASAPSGTAGPRATAASGGRDGGSAARCVVPLGEPPARAAEPARFCPADPDGAPRLPRQAVTFPEAPGAPRVAVEVAREPEHRERGLMYRTELAEDAGMLFSWDHEAPRSFWMRNTCLPLDMLFLAKDGTVAGILEQVPVMNEAPRSVPCPAAHVLEVNAGWSRRHGVAPGQRVVIGK
ncbi:MAG: DUF192 domain-containing protein [Polyangiaceae bacterium]|nr:DUF192 domain-containing protein [Polyangiaceae bacterium]